MLKLTEMVMNGDVDDTLTLPPLMFPREQITV
jgi:hypothetical protein